MTRLRFVACLIAITLAGNAHAIDPKQWDAFLHDDSDPFGSFTMSYRSIVEDVLPALARLESPDIQMTPGLRQRVFQLIMESAGRTLPLDAIEWFPRSRKIVDELFVPAVELRKLDDLPCVGRFSSDPCVSLGLTARHVALVNRLSPPYGLFTLPALLRHPNPEVRSLGISVLERQVSITEAERLLDRLHDQELVTIMWSWPWSASQTSKVTIPVAAHAAAAFLEVSKHLPPARVAPPDATEQAMNDLVIDIWKTHDLRTRVTRDEWGQPLQWAVTETGPDDVPMLWVWSYGPDGNPGGRDDIVRQAFLSEKSLNEPHAIATPWVMAVRGTVERPPQPRGPLPMDEPDVASVRAAIINPMDLLGPDASPDQYGTRFGWLVCDADLVVVGLEREPTPKGRADRITWYMRQVLGKTFPVASLDGVPHVRQIIRKDLEGRRRDAATLQGAACIGRGERAARCVGRGLTRPQLKALQRMRSDRTALPAALDLLADRSATLRAIGIDVIAQHGATTETDRLLPLLSDQETVVVIADRATNPRVADIASAALDGLARPLWPAETSEPDLTELSMQRVADAIRHDRPFDSREHTDSWLRPLHHAVAANAQTVHRMLWVWSDGNNRQPGGGDDVIRELDLDRDDARWTRAVLGNVDEMHAPLERPKRPCDEQTD
jgi:hypothetical protein